MKYSHYTILALLLASFLFSSFNGEVSARRINSEDCDDDYQFPNCVNEYCDVWCYNEQNAQGGTCRNKNTCVCHDCVKK
ncbi:hypothetical protein H6P81_010200 [Aristolochia fimbriata]|uniref:Uncharacterized protein n=1 Tax=Aristolochia fimbriata TaxID=158543 RepID=A0AAV7EQ82_ARIFI|nr:hypothetical protein H6P81_010096 [Aristolochia fimbriata]KAG9450235.1 hypothetical protein H6P81_010200 [Aristolochia fimbriata]